MPYNYVIHPRVYKVIDLIYDNVSKKYYNSYSYELMAQNVSDAYDAILKIENGFIRRKPTLTQWKGLYMASYKVECKTRWNYAYRIEGDTVYVEDACHAQNMSEFSSSTTSTPMPLQQKYRKLTTKPLFGYSFVMNDKKEYNLLTKDGQLLTQWFMAIAPLKDSRPYGKYQIIAYINVGGWLCALGYDGKVYNMNRTWREVYTEDIHSLKYKDMIIETIENQSKRINLSKDQFKKLLIECITKIINEIA